MTEQEIKDRASGIKLVALDMDGTCLDTKSVMNSHTREAVTRLVDAGYIVVPATGRPFQRLFTDTFPIENIKYVISENGAIVTEAETGKKLRRRVIPLAEAVEIATELPKDDVCTYMHYDDGMLVRVMREKDEDLYNRLFGRFGKLFRDNICCGVPEDYVEKTGKDVVKMGTWFLDVPALEKCRANIHSHFPDINCVQGDETLLEFTHSEASKGQALEALASILGIERGQVCAIGDNGNDLSMIQYAGIGVAMGNALDYVRAQADYVTATNDEDGVAQFLERFLLKE